MKKTAAVLLLLLGLGIWSTVFAFQRYNSRYESEMQDPADDPPDAREPAEYTFARLRYRAYGSGGFRRRRSSWATDSNKAERQLIQGVRRLTRIQARSVEEIIEVDSDEMYNWPWLYAVEVGHWELDNAQAKRIRDYLDRGGFLMVDDFHGTREWNVFLESLQRVFPEEPVVDIQENDPILHTLYDLHDRVQVPGKQYLYSGRTYEQDGYEARWRAVYDKKGRIQVAICHNMDLGDAWEWADDPAYPERFASLAYRIGMNYIVYSMTH